MATHDSKPRVTINVTTGQFYGILGLMALWFATFFVAIGVIYSFIDYDMTIFEVSALHSAVFYTCLISAFVSGVLTYSMGYLTRKWEIERKDEKSTPG